MAVSTFDRAFARIRRELWSAPPEGAPPWRHGALHTARVLWLAADGYQTDSCFLRASALTLASMLALVPALAASFATIRGLGWTGERLETLLLQKATILSTEAVSAIVSYVDNISITGVGLVGALFAFGSAISLLFQIEAAFDAVWGNPRGRSRMREAADALVLLVLGPALLALVASSETALRSSTVLAWLASFGAFGEALLRLGFGAGWSALVCATFTALYLFFPATPVSRRSALVGGIVAGLAWQFAQSLYVEFQIGIASYNAIYGALAQIPILVFWMWTSWVIVLAGAEIVAADQNLQVCGRHYRSTIGGSAAHERLALVIAIELADAAYARRQAPTMVSLAKMVAMPVRSVAEIFASLCNAGLVHTGGEDQRQCFLSLSPGSIPVERVLLAARGDELSERAEIRKGAERAVELRGDRSVELHGDRAVEPQADRPREKAAVSRVLRRLAEARREALAGATLADLVEQQRQKEADAPGRARPGLPPDAA